MDPQDNNNPNTDNTTPPTTGAEETTSPASTPSDQTAGAVDLNDLSSMPDPTTPVETPAEPQDEASDAAAPASTIDKDPNITIDSSDDPAQDIENPKTLDVKPAAPMPGSIGSATSGPASPDDAPVADDSASQDSPDASKLVEEAAATTAAVPEQPAPTVAVPAEKPHRSTTILSVVLIVALVIACAVLAIMLVQANQKANDNSKHQQATTSTSSVATLVCTADVTAKQPESLQPVAKAQSTVSFSYKDQEFSELTSVTQYTFEDASAATAKLDTLKSTYKDNYSAAGMTQDPFTSEFSVNNAVAKASHMITADNLSRNNAALIGLNLGEISGQVNTEQTEVKKALEADGYICAVGEVNTTESK